MELKSFPLLGIGTYPLRGDCLRRCVRQAYETGYRLVDTAFKYSNEEEIRQCLSEIDHDGEMLLQSKLSVTQLTSKRIFGLTYYRNTVVKALSGTCKRLGVKCIDIYLLHSPNRCVELYGELIKLREKGMVKTIGGCRMEEDHIEKIHQLYGEYPTVNQIEVHPYYSNKFLIRYCKDKGIIIEARSPFAHGDLMEEFQNEYVLQSIGRKYRKSVPQVILRWIVQQGLTVIPRSCHPEHIKENFDIFDFQLTENEMNAIDSLNKDQSMGCLSKQTRV